MTIRFFILPAHPQSGGFQQRSITSSRKRTEPTDGSSRQLEKITPAATSNVDVKSLRTKCFEAMNDDLNTPIVISHLFDGAKMINNIIAGNNTILPDDLKELKEVFHTFCFDILGLRRNRFVRRT